MSDKLELKPCPFCGGEAYRTEAYLPLLTLKIEAYAVKCLHCQACAYGMRQSDATKAWNRRAKK